MGRITLVIGFFTLIGQAQAGFPAVATEATQIANNLQLTAQVMETIKQTQVIANQLSDMRTHGALVSQHNWGSATSNLQRLMQLIKTGKSLAFTSSNLDAQYRTLFPGFQTYNQQKQGTSETYSQRYDDWSKANHATIVSTVKAAQMQGDFLTEEESTVASLKSLGQSAHGRMQALQVGNMIAVEQVGQLQKLRALMAAQVQMQTAYTAFKSSEDDAAHARSKSFFKNDNKALDVRDGMSF
jgi:P-type conjugative transfer protein TrbJ